MNSGHVEDDPAEIFALMPDLERSASFPVIGNADGAVVFLPCQAIGDCACGDPVCDLLRAADFTVQNQQTVGGQQRRKVVEGIADICQILEEIHMVFFYI